MFSSSLCSSSLSVSAKHTCFHWMVLNAQGLYTLFLHVLKPQQKTSSFDFFYLLHTGRQVFQLWRRLQQHKNLFVWQYGSNQIVTMQFYQ